VRAADLLDLRAQLSPFGFSRCQFRRQRFCFASRTFQGATYFLELGGDCFNSRLQLARARRRCRLLRLT
jgi:hypothetical protein